jgi:hypothetical protein
MDTMVRLLALSCLSAAGYSALAGPRHPPLHGHQKCELRCPRCQCCVPSVDVEKIKETCWEVEYEPICIPHVTFPWERKYCRAPCGELVCPPAKCARTRNVHVLKLVEYECKQCKYSWKPVCAPRCSNGSHACGEGVASGPPDVSHLPSPPVSTQPRQSTGHWKFGL